EFDVYSRRAAGTALVVVLQPRAQRPAATAPTWRVSGVSVVKPGEDVCGDDWATRETEDSQCLILVVDGLGHGAAAAEAAGEAVRLFRENPTATPTEMLGRLHQGLRPTRGAAAAVAAIAPDRQQLVYAGVGNIAGVVLCGERPRALVSHNGILGHTV